MPTELITAAISFVAAVVAVMVGQALGSRGQLSLEERRWARDEDHRRRVHSEDVARKAMELLAKVTDFLSWDAGYARGRAAGHGHRWDAPPIEEISVLVRPVRRAAIEIGDPGIRAHLASCCELLVNGNAAESYGAPEVPKIAWAVQQSSEILIGAYLRGVEPTDEPDTETATNARETLRRARDAVDTLYSSYEEEGD